MSRLTHGLSRTKLYYLWLGVKRRCNNPRDINYYNYGARGIKLSKEWDKDFLAFKQDMEATYRKGLHLDRIDNDKGYSRENCRWVTPSENGNNRRNNHRLTYNGRTMTITQWERTLGLPKGRLKTRINKLKWPVAKALTEPKKINGVKYA
jgi:hypothetical protein